MNKSRILNTYIGITKIILALTVGSYTIVTSYLIEDFELMLIIPAITFLFCFYLLHSGWTQVKGKRMNALLFWIGVIIGSFIVWFGIEVLFIIDLHGVKFRLLAILLMIFSMLNDFLRLYCKGKTHSVNLEKHKTNLTKRKSWLYIIVPLLTILIGLAVHVCNVHMKQKRPQTWSERINSFIDDDTTSETLQNLYELRMDMRHPELPRDLFYKHADSLAYGLASLFADKTFNEYRELLYQARSKRDPYFLIKNDILPAEVEVLKTLPLVRLGSNYGIIIEKSGVVVIEE